MDTRPPDALHPPDDWQPDPPPGTVLAWGPFTVVLEAGERIGYRLVQEQGVLTWDDGDRVHYLADDGGWQVYGDVVPDALLSATANDGPVTIRPMVPTDYEYSPALRELTPSQAAAWLRRLWRIPS